MNLVSIGLKLLFMVTFFVSPWASAGQFDGELGLPDACANLMEQRGPNEGTVMERLISQAAAIMNVRSQGVQALSLQTYSDTQHPAVTSVQDGNYYWVDTGAGKQVVTKLDALETKVLKRAFLGGNSVPAVTFRAYRRDEKLDLGKIYVGMGTEITDTLLIESINEFLADYRRQHDDFEALEIIFSRLEIDAIGGDDFITHPLGPDNFGVAQTISMEVERPVIITAVTPNGYSYEAVFYGEENITYDVFNPDN